MGETMVYIILILIGLCAGSFAGASIWRLRARQLHDDKANHERYDHRQYDKLKKVLHKSLVQDRSVCLNCSYKLKWFDMIPVFSWLYLKGKCRECRHKIGIMEPLLELGLALFFVGSFIFWPYQLDTLLEITRFIVWLVSGVAMAMLFVYDLKWFILPDKVSFGFMGVALVGAIATVFSSSDPLGATYSIIVAGLILSGLYYLLNVVSSGRWVGFGDVKLGVGLALLLANWQLAFIALFTANLVGCLIVVPLMLTGKLKRDSHVPLGPLLIVGTIIAQLGGQAIIDWYINTLI